MQRAAQDYKFNTTLTPRLDRAIEDWHETQPQTLQPIRSEQPVNEDLQTEASSALGGELRIRAPWASLYRKSTKP